MEKYKNPENTTELNEKIRNCPTLGDVYSLVNSIFPTWIKCFLKEYSHDYPHLQTNWTIALQDKGLKPTSIMIVDYLLASGEEYSLIRDFAEIFSQAGFIVRSEDELGWCSVCNRGVPGKAQHEEMKKRGLQVPIEWSEKCIGC